MEGRHTIISNKKELIGTYASSEEAKESAKSKSKLKKYKDKDGGFFYHRVGSKHYTQILVGNMKTG